MSTTTAVSLITTAVSDAGAGIYNVLVPIIALSVALMVVYFGWKKLRSKGVK
jgi:TRAP-type C4-dicarboxylate transport system permease small subunit